MSRLWSKEDTDELIRDVLRGVPRKESAKKFGRTEGAVRKKVAELRKKGRIPEHKENLFPHDPKITQEGNLAQLYQVVEHDIEDSSKLSQLLIDAGVDLDVWEVYKSIIKQQQVFSKKEDIDLEFHRGRTDGTKRIYPEHLISTLWHVHAYMVRREPIALRPYIQPIRLPDDDWGGSGLPKIVRDFESVLAISDTQIGYEKSLRTAKLTPFHDRQVLDIAVQVAENEQPDVIAFLGDWFDLADWTDRWIVSPQSYWTTQPSLEEFGYWLWRFKLAAPRARFLFFEGNHEKRLADKIAKHNNESFGIRKITELANAPVMSLPYLLGLEETGVEWFGGYPKNSYKLTPFLKLGHGTKAVNKSGGTVTKVLENAWMSMVVGHCHRDEIAYKRVPGESRSIVAVSVPCACHTDGRTPGSSDHSNWQKGFSLIRHKDDLILPTNIRVIGGKGYVGEEVYTALDERTIVERLKLYTQDEETEEPRWNY